MFHELDGGPLNLASNEFRNVFITHKSLSAQLLIPFKPE